MLEDYQTHQPIIYSILKNQIKKEECSHAYLFETNGYNDSYNFIMSFVKSVLCPNKFINKNNCNNCKQCKVIESGNFPEIKIINSDGMWIKKEQLRELQSEFNEKAIIGNKRIYIINKAEKLNTSSANSILKFLEEPEEGIIAILITENIYEVLETIRSRCQILRLKKSSIKKDKQNYKEKIKKILYQNRENSEKLMKDELVDEKIEKIVDFVNYYENHHLDTILYIGKLWNDYIKNKEEIEEAFDIMIMYYRDIINIKNNKDSEIFPINEKIKSIAENNELLELCKKINTIIKQKQNIRYNANTNLLTDKLVIDLEGGIK